jgi:hypothetical protein
MCECLYSVLRCYWCVTAHQDLLNDIKTQKKANKVRKNRNGHRRARKRRQNSIISQHALNQLYDLIMY